MTKYSSELTQNPRRGAARAMLHGVGLSTADLAKAQVGVASVWFGGNPCNAHLLGLAKDVKISLEQEDLLGFRFNTCGVSDAMSMGTLGMRYSLPSRDLIADSIESVVQAQGYDGVVAIPGCDKNLPGCLIALARLNRPGLVVYGGTIRPGKLGGDRVDVISAFQSYGELLAGRLTQPQREKLLQAACPGHGACGGMYTANTMACAIEAMGMALPGSASTPAADKQAECAATGTAVAHLLEKNICPGDIMTPGAFRNALTMVVAMGGSTNAVIHLLAVAHAAGVRLDLEDIQQISEQVPVLADLKPSGRYLMQDVHDIGGFPGVMKILHDAGYLDGSCLTVTGKTLAENLNDAQLLAPGQRVIAPLKDPILPFGHIRVLRGNLAPQGAVAKITGKEGFTFTGPARVFDAEAQALAAIEQGVLKPGEVLVIRYVGPRGAPGMPEMLTITSALVGAGLARNIAVVTDGRFSGGSHGFLVGHVVPEAYDGGLIALLEDGDPIVLDGRAGTIRVALSDGEITLRKQGWRRLEKEATGTLLKYRRLVGDASTGCLTDE